MSTLKKCTAIGVAALALALILATPGAAAVKYPPSIGDLHGTVWACKVSGTGYYLLGGGKESIKGTSYMMLIQEDVNILRIDFEDPEMDDQYGRYYPESGVLVIGDLNDDELATELTWGFFIFSGTPGKMKVGGEAVNYDIVSDGEGSVIKIAGKQILIF